MKKIYCLTILIFILLPEYGFYSLSAQETKTTIENYISVKSYYDSFLNKLPKGTKPGNKYMNRWLWNHRNDYDTSGNMRVPAFEFNQADNFNKQNSESELSQSGWVPVGPVTIPPSYEPRSCYSMGRVNCIAFHPSDSNIMWIGTPGGGIWKSVSHGKNWFPVSDFLPTLAISHISVNPKNPDIVYAATGDFDISGMTSTEARGVIKSTDGGDTWSFTGLVNDTSYRGSALRKILINPVSPDRLFAAGRRGIWLSTDAGDNWTRVCDSIISDLEMHPTNPDILYAPMINLWGSGTTGILKSNDAGRTWSALETNLPPQTEISRMDLAISPADPNYIYTLNVKTNTNGMHSFSRSTDAGATWETMNLTDSTDNVLGAWGGDINDRYGQAFYDLVLLPDPTDKRKLYTGGVNMWMTENGGDSFELASFWIYVFGASIHADHHFAAYNPLDQFFYWCNDGGVYRTRKIEPGSKMWVNEWIDKSSENLKPGAPDFKFPTEWENLSDGLAITEFYRMNLCKNIPNILAAGSQDNSCYYFNNGNWLNYIPNYDGMETMINNDNPDIFYGVWQFGGLNRTRDGGKTLTPGLSDTIANLERGNWVTPTAMDPLNPEVIYMGFKNLWRSDNGGDSWVKIFDFDSTGEEKINASSLQIIEMSPSDGKYFSMYKEISWYQDTAKNWKRAAGELWITSDGGLKWKKSTSGLPVDSMNIISLTYDDVNPLKMWAAIYTWNNTINTYITTDGGDSWQDISKPVPYGILLRTIVHQPGSYEHTLYAGTNKGVYYTNDSLAEWKPYSVNLPITIINELKIQSSTGELYAATYGRGVWKTNLLPSGVNDIAGSRASITAYPNPSNGIFTLTIDESIIALPNLHIQIIDITGRTVLEKSIVSDKTNNINIKTNLQPGVYFIQLFAGNKSYSGKIVIGK